MREYDEARIPPTRTSIDHRVPSELPSALQLGVRIGHEMSSKLERSEHHLGDLLSGDDLACAMVGYYFQQFAMVEIEVNDCLGSALKLDNLQKDIIRSNLDLQRKLFVLRSLNSIASWPAEQAKEYDKSILEFERELELRNFVAHSPFFATDDERGVKFYPVKAKKKLEWPEITWSLIEFRAIMTRLEQMEISFRAIDSAFSKAHLDEKQKAAASALLLGGLNTGYGASRDTGSYGLQAGLLKGTFGISGPD